MVRFVAQDLPAAWLYGRVLMPRASSILIYFLTERGYGYQMVFEVDSCFEGSSTCGPSSSRTLMDKAHLFIHTSIMTPGNWRVTVISILFAVLWACLALLHRIFPSLKVEFPLREPPQISSTVPYVGHLIRIFIHKNHYYTKLR